MDFIKKLQNKPDGEKKIILWSVIIFAAIIFIGLWLYVCSKNLKEFQESDILKQVNYPSADFPEFEAPAGTDEDFEEFEKIIQELENER